MCRAKEEMLEVSWNRGTPKSSTVTGFTWIFHYKPSILGYPRWWKTPPYVFQATRPLRGRRRAARSLVPRPTPWSLRSDASRVSQSFRPERRRGWCCPLQSRNTKPQMGLSMAMGVPPIAGWLISWNIPPRNGWWLGVSPFRKPPNQFTWLKSIQITLCLVCGVWGQGKNMKRY